MNASMPALAAAFEDAGFAAVATVISSGNVVFRARSTSPRALERRAEKALEAGLGRSFLTIVRATDDLQRILDGDPFRDLRLPKDAKRVVTFLRRPTASPLALPIVRPEASILAATPTEVFSAYVPSPAGGAFMKVIEDAYGTEVTTRTWGTVQKLVARSLAT